MDIIELPICQQKWLDIGNSMHSWDFQDFQCFATVTHASTHRSDRCDHSPNRPHAADAADVAADAPSTRGRRGRRAANVRPTLRRRIAADYERHNAFLVFITNALDARPTLRLTMNRPLAQSVKVSAFSGSRIGYRLKPSPVFVLA